MKNPAAAMRAKKMPVETNLLDLIVGMIQPDPANRYTID